MKSEQTVWDIGGTEIPVKIFRERRSNARISLRRSGIIIRLPQRMSAQGQVEQIGHFRRWAEEKVRRNASYREHFAKKEYANGAILRVGKRQYQLAMSKTAKSRHSGVLHNNYISLKLSEAADVDHLNKAVKRLLSRIVAKDFYPEILRRVQELNHLTVRREINAVSLKYSHSKWGSCSSKANITLSTCLLFAPDPVIDYVIIHELAHLVEPNHSERFWALVAEHMPSYREQEHWLKKNWHLCDF